MADNTPIEWADATVNAVNGCSVLSPGCKHCYAMKQAHRVDFRHGLVSRTAGGQVWTGEVYLHEKSLLQPLRWRRPRRIFWNAHGDLFHENVPDAWIDRVFAVCALTPQHTHMILTKRPERMREYVNDENTHFRVAMTDLNRKYQMHSVETMFRAMPLPNVWLGTSAEDQPRADERIPHLLATPAARRFVSLEPLLGPVDLTRLRPDGINFTLNALLGKAEHLLGFRSHLSGLDWVIVGGESGPGARPMHPDWARSLRDQCAAAGVPFFFKQWGAWLPIFEHPWNAIAAECCPDPAAQSPFDHVVWDGERWEAMNGCWDDSDSWYVAQTYSEPEQELARVGKKRAGRLLDGREHSDFPSTPTRIVGSAGEPA